MFTSELSNIQLWKILEKGMEEIFHPLNKAAIFPS